jgi:hypothetical protein
MALPDLVLVLIMLLILMLIMFHGTDYTDVAAGYMLDTGVCGGGDIWYTPPLSLFFLLLLEVRAAPRLHPLALVLSLSGDGEAAVRLSDNKTTCLCEEAALLCEPPSV